jgi:DNA invertase Pin-like site-specific DNA recombinase
MTFRTDSSAPPLAFVYDRFATANKVILRLRLETCAQYAETQSWQIGGWFVDEGDDALTTDTRPAFDAMCNTIRAAYADTPRVCLVYDCQRGTRRAPTAAARYSATAAIPTTSPALDQ